MSECYLHWPNFESMQLRIHSKLSLEPIAIPANSNYHQTSSNSPRYFLPPTSGPSGAALSWVVTIVCRLIMPGKIALLIHIRNCFKEPPKKVLDNTRYDWILARKNQAVDTAKFVPRFHAAAYQWIPGPPRPSRPPPSYRWQSALGPVCLETSRKAGRTSIGLQIVTLLELDSIWKFHGLSKLQEIRNIMEYIYIYHINFP